MTVKVLRSREGSAEIECSFCEGAGIDPFYVMSTRSRCPVCGGRARLRLREPLHECAFCGGSGVQPQTRMTCTACLGKGAVTARGPTAECMHCHGTGANGYGRMPCTTCRGIGVVRAATKSPSGAAAQARKLARRKGNKKQE